MLAYSWPLALDVLWYQWKALPSQKLLHYQTQFYDKAGPNMMVKLFGGTGYLTIDPKNIEAIVSSRFEDFEFGSRSAGLYPFLGEGIFTQDGPAWKKSRELLRRQFARMQYQNLRVFDEHVDALEAKLTADSDGVVDLQPAFFDFTLSTTTALIFGEPVSNLSKDQSDAFEQSFNYASYISAIRIRLNELCWLYTPADYKKACKTIKMYAEHFVREALREKTSETHSDLHAFILNLYEELEDVSLVRDQLIHVLIAGRDTTACMMSWAVYLLVRHPSALKRLQQEIAEVVGDEKLLTRAHVSRMTYLRYVLKETLRLYPQLPINARSTNKTTLLPSGGGPDGRSPVLLPKGTGVGYSLYHMHRQKSLYGEDAEEFRPERWEGPELDNIGFGYLDFHGRPRTCLGSKSNSSSEAEDNIANTCHEEDFALMEASCAITRILQTFPDMKLAPDLPTVPTGQERQNLTITVSIAEGCKVLLKYSRSSDRKSDLTPMRGR